MKYHVNYELDHMGGIVHVLYIAMLHKHIYIDTVNSSIIGAHHKMEQNE